MEKTQKRYKFLREGMRSDSGRCRWKLGVWKKYRGKLEMCESGFHCSKRAYDAFSYVQGEILTEVEVRGKSVEGDNKEVWSEMRVVRAWKWTKKDSVSFAVYMAEQVLGIFERVYPNYRRPREAILAAKRWLKDPTDENAVAARAARVATWAAAWTATWAATWAAAGAAAGDAGAAAWAAARAATWAARASGDAVLVKANRWMKNRIRKLEEV